MEDISNEELSRINAEVLEHMMHPKNYGVMEDANGVGMAVDKKTGEFAMVYIKIEDSKIANITFGVNACQDTVVAGSLFTEMVKGDTLDNGIKALKLMNEKLLNAPKNNKYVQVWYWRLSEVLYEIMSIEKKGSMKIFLLLI